MGIDTKIQWTSKTWNPFQGCHKISEGCKNCYMFADKKRYGNDGNVVVRSKNATFNKPLIWHKSITPETPMEDRLVFTASWSDWFIEENDAHRAEAWEIIRQTPNLIYQILTKRADRLKDCLPSDWGNGYENVWLGVSVENQKRANERIPLLLDVPARIRFLSCEPLLEKVNLTSLNFSIRQLIPHQEAHNCLSGSKWIYNDLTKETTNFDKGNKIDWIILGGESGPKARSFNLDHALEIVLAAKAANVPIFCKQLGKFPVTENVNLFDFPESVEFAEWGTAAASARVKLKNSKGGDFDEFPSQLKSREFPSNG